MKKILFLLSSFAFAATVCAQQDNSYQFTVDLTKVHNDLLTVNLVTPKMTADTVVYHMPAMVPGTYKIYNFGKFVKDFKAVDNAGKEIAVIKADQNSWKIPNAKSLASISYDVEDSWDTELKGEFVFEPAGTNFQPDSNFVLNNHLLYGYFEGMKRNAYKINIIHPLGFYGATGLSNVERRGNSDTYTVPDYMQLVDGPMMYNRPDTAHVLVGGADILISVYSPKKLVTAHFVADSLRKLLDMQRQYLGGTLPIKNYAFIIYLNGNPKGFKSGSFGALEHSYSSMYCLPEMEQERIAQTMIDVSAHEFFHIVTPLNIHSQEIGDFDYNRPAMSQHLWMYEGLTEYAAHHVQIKYGSVQLEDFLSVMRSKMIAAEEYDEDLSFTKMSKGALEKHEDQYNNVYQKGALIGMCLDIRLRQLSGGTYGTQEMMRDLSKKYGKDQSFTDDSLFSDIVKLTYPEIGDFFKRYVIGAEMLPYKEMLEAVGVDYSRRGTEEVLDPFGGFGFRLDQEGNLRLWPETVNDFGEEMGYQKGDIPVSLNGKAITLATLDLVLTEYDAKVKEGDKLILKVKRLENGKWKNKKLKGKIRKVTIPKKHILTPMQNPTPAQLKLRKAWINK
ncbi:MAG: peptidase M61 [Bacteroidota bacterium]|nr:peptidase M61 [Bacteroidota bacterium]